MNLIESAPRIVPTVLKKRVLPNYEDLGISPWDNLWPDKALTCKHRERKTNQRWWKDFEIVPLEGGWYQKICHNEECKYYYFENNNH